MPVTTRKLRIAHTRRAPVAAVFSRRPALSLAATAAGASTTPDTSALVQTITLAPTLAQTSLTPDTVNLATSGQINLTATLAQTSATGDTASITVTRALGASLAQTSTTPDNAALNAARALAATLAQTSTTPDTANLATAKTNYNVSFGAGYTDGTPKQLVRTTGNTLYLVVSNCDAYPCDNASQTLRVLKANTTGVPTASTRQDSVHEPAGAAGWAIAIDGSNVIHIAYTIRTTNGGNLTDLKYTTFDTATDTWGTPVTVDTGLSFSAGQGDESVTLALDSSGVPHVVYLKTDGTRRRVTYRNRSGGTWSSATTVDDQSFGANEKCWHPNLVFDSSGRGLVLWHIGAFNDDQTGKFYSRVRSAAGAFGTTVQIATSLHVGIDQCASAYVSASGRYHVAAILPEQPVLSAAYIRHWYSDNQGASWTAAHPSNQATHNPILGPGPAGTIRIYGHGTPDSGNHGQNIYEMQSSDDGATWGTWTQIVTGTNYDSSVNTRWSQFFHSWASTLDIAYWNDNYPNNVSVGVDITGSDLTAIIAQTSAAPDAAALAAARGLAASLAATSLTPDTAVDTIGRALAAALAQTSTTPDTATLGMLYPLSAGLASSSLTPDTSTARIARALTSPAAAASTTPDTSAILAARGLDASVAQTSFTPDTAAALVARKLTPAVAQTSTTNDLAILTKAGFVDLLATIAQTSSGADAALAVARGLVAGLAGLSATADLTILSRDFALVTSIAQTSVTTDVAGVLVGRVFGASLVGAALTNDSAALLLARTLVASAAGISVTPNTPNLLTAEIEGLVTLSWIVLRPRVAVTAAAPSVVFEEA